MSSIFNKGAHNMQVITKKELLLSDSRGIYIPRDFLDLEVFNCQLSEEDKEVLKDPEHEWYWETWYNVLEGEYIDKDGEVWTLEQDGDLWAVQYTEAEEVCQDCIMLIANGELPVDCSEERAQELESISGDWACCSPVEGEQDYDAFSYSSCDCCGSSLGGSRYPAIELTKELLKEWKEEKEKNIERYKVS